MSKLIYAILLVKQNDKKLIDIIATLKGYADAPLHIVQLNNVAAIVCETSEEGLNKDVSHILAYANIIESLMIDFTLLPMRFGSKIESTSRVFAMLLKNAPGFEQKLLSLEHKWEFGLKINFDGEALKEDLTLKAGFQNRDIENQSTKENSSIFRQYVYKKLAEHRLEEQYLSFKERVLLRITENFAQLNARFLFDKHGGTGKLIDTYILMEISKKEVLLKLVNEFQQEFSSISFTLTGPWPPYNFVDITLK